MSVVLRPMHDNYAVSFGYKFRDYFDAILRNSYIPLEKENVTYRFFTPFSTSDWVEYAKEIIWFGRRNGRMMFSSMPNVIEEI